MSFTLELAYLRSTVLEDLGDVADLVGSEMVDRWLNQAQRRMEPDVLLASTSAISVAVGDTSVTLPSDLVQIVEFEADANSYSFPTYHQHGYGVRFKCAVTTAWTGTLLYLAHYPAITDNAPAQIPEAAADGLVSFALYKAFRRFAANRAEYRKFATIVGNGVTMGDLESTAEAHLQDFADAVAAAAPPPAATTFYE